MSERYPIVRALAVLPWIAVALAGCELPPQGHPEPEDQRTPPAPTDETLSPMNGFSWVVPESLAAMPRPGRHGDDGLEDDLASLRAVGIDLLVSLTVVPVDPGAVRGHGMTPMHLPVRDFTAPTMDQLRQFVDQATLRIEQGQRVGVHCTAGKGRTGTVMAAYFVHTGMEPDQAIAAIRDLRPGSIETRDQELAVHEFAALVAGGLIDADEPPPTAVW